jgi:hypothetical protein
MKKLYTFLAAILLTATTFAQTPEKMSYQAVVRDSGDALVTNQAVGMQISILQTTATATETAVYVETQTPTTNVNGLVTLEIGGSSATVVSGTFSTIDWSIGTYFIKTETDPAGGTTYTITGTSQLMSVPYALHAKTVTQPTYNVNTFYAELGGYVIEINTDGTHGLVVAMQDQGTSSWYVANDLLSNATNHDANGAMFKDWRLPTRRELNLMYTQRISIGGFDLSLNAPGYSIYWSSTEYDPNNAWGQVFTNGNQGVAIKSLTSNVRAVRAF